MYIINLISRLINLAIPISEIESSGRGFDADAKVERNGMRSGEQNRCLGFRGRQVSLGTLFGPIPSSKIKTKGVESLKQGQLLGRNTVLQELESLELEKIRVKTEAKLQFLCREQWNLNQLQLPVPDEPNIHHIHDFLERSFFIDETVRDKILGLTNMYIDLKNNGATTKITEDGGGEGEGDAFLRIGGTRGTTYWITPVRHEAGDAESAPMPLAMPCLVPLPRHGGGFVARHEHRAKGRLSNSSEPPYLIPT
ncbi:hypothetical protein CQW23_10755 [Capsicum baccatum]|uniref:Uncharacterized protein n=1 Tax=Capsicum baccatum TaxID=33114 RepID=A0A2G2X0I5_CAPBA|nr:hypothetical protein CQW23_10755 [Capsicum baccatum]